MYRYFLKFLQLYNVLSFIYQNYSLLPVLWSCTHLWKSDRQIFITSNFIMHGVSSLKILQPPKQASRTNPELRRTEKVKIDHHGKNRKQSERYKKVMKMNLPPQGAISSETMYVLPETQPRVDIAE